MSIWSVGTSWPYVEPVAVPAFPSERLSGAKSDRSRASSDATPSGISCRTIYRCLRITIPNVEKSDLLTYLRQSAVLQLPREKSHRAE